MKKHVTIFLSVFYVGVTFGNVPTKTIKIVENSTYRTIYSVHFDGVNPEFKNKFLNQVYEAENIVSLNQCENNDCLLSTDNKIKQVDFEKALNILIEKALNSSQIVKQKP
jgi:hypothetical protein